MTQSVYSTRNDKQGDWYEEIAAQFFSRKLNEDLQEHNHTHGIDLIYPSQKIEVKGIESLFQRNKHKQKYKYQIRNWKIHKTQMKYETTLYAFILFDKSFFPEPVIFTVSAEKVHARIKGSTSLWVWFPLWWVKKHHLPELSRLPWNRENYSFRPVHEISEIIRPPLKETLTQIFHQKHYSLDELEVLQKFFREFSDKSWHTNPIIGQFLASIHEQIENIPQKESKHLNIEDIEELVRPPAEKIFYVK